MRRFFHSAILFCSISVASAEEEAQWKVIEHEGRQYVTAENIAEFYDYTYVSKTPEGVALTGQSPATRLVSGGSQIEFSARGRSLARLDLFFPWITVDGKILVSAVDLAGIIDPVLRPSHLDAEPIDLVVIETGDPDEKLVKQLAFELNRRGIKVSSEPLDRIGEKDRVAVIRLTLERVGNPEDAKLKVRIPKTSAAQKQSVALAVAIQSHLGFYFSEKVIPIRFAKNDSEGIVPCRCVEMSFAIPDPEKGKETVSDRKLAEAIANGLAKHNRAVTITGFRGRISGPFFRCSR